MCFDTEDSKLLLPFGVTNGDSVFSTNSSEGHSGPLSNTNTPFSFYGVIQDTIFVSSSYGTY